MTIAASPAGANRAHQLLDANDDARLTSGANFWTTKAVDGHEVTFSDGPHGVRAQEAAADHLGISPSLPATCFPPASGLAQSWDRTLVEEVGNALGAEAAHLGVDVLLGPGVNIKRDPRGGRNFEYLSEDPHLAGVLGAAWVDGVQSRGVGASVKHFAANSAETDRMRSDSQLDERTLREIYLPAFRRIVEKSRPWTVMCSYNRINGVYASENERLLTTILRGEWGFDGVVISDWGAVRDRVAATAAGLDLAMPGGDESADLRLADAVRDGLLPADTLAAAADRVRNLVERSTTARTARGAVDVDFDAHHDLARRAAARSIVLLKNDANALPLGGSERIAVIGPHASHPRFQGGGSSHVNPTIVDRPLEGIRARATTVRFAPGWPDADAAETDEETLLSEAVAAARDADVAVIFLGLDEQDESEGYDRTDISLPARQLEVLRAVGSVQSRLVAVLSHGGVVDLGEVSRRAAAIIDGGLLGQGVGTAIAQVLFGEVNPSGKLAETVPMRLADAPAYLSFPEEEGVARYGEGVYVGYRSYDSRSQEVRYPFGHGLSYTSFEYAETSAHVEGDELLVRASVTNSGDREGREVVQVYVGRPQQARRNPVRELKAFEVIDMRPGQSRLVDIRIPLEELEGWDSRRDSWVLEGGTYAVAIGASSRDIRAEHAVTIDGNAPRRTLSLESTLGEVMSDPVVGPLLRDRLRGDDARTDQASAALGGDVARLVASIPLDRLPAFTAGKFDTDRIAQLIARIQESGEIPDDRSEPAAT